MDGTTLTQTANAATSRAARRAPCVLVVDDEPSIREFLAFVLADEGFTVLTAGDGNEALAIAQQTPPDVVLTDLMMPGADGYHLINGLREQRVPVRAIIAMSAVHTVGVRVPRADLFVAKPFQIEQIVTSIRALLAE